MANKKGFVWGAAAVFCVLGASVGHADGLSMTQIERVKVSKVLLEEVDAKPLQSTIAELESTPYPEENLQILEAVARTYDEIIREQNLVEGPQKEWLHGMIRLNMAYLQFGGSEETVGGRSALNRLICRKLKTHLPVEIWDHPGIFHPIE